jgi:hypothetical protein
MTADALNMLDAFVSVGAATFDLTTTSLAGDKIEYRKSIEAANLRHRIPEMIADATIRKENIILRPHAPCVSFIQLDDLTSTMVDRLASVALFTLETSTGSHQAWIAIRAEEFSSDLVRRLRKGTGADSQASGATRVAGSRNYKVRHSPDFPLIKLLCFTPGRITSQAQLEALELVSAPNSEQPGAGAVRLQQNSFSTAWPRYEICLQRAPLKRDNTPDRSKADFYFVLTALSWGRQPNEIVARLLSVSAHVKERKNPVREAERTVDNAVRLQWLRSVR